MGCLNSPPGFCDSAVAEFFAEFGKLHRILQKTMFSATQQIFLEKILNIASYFAPNPSRSFFIIIYYRPATTEVVFICFTFVFLVSCLLSFLKIKLFLYFTFTEFLDHLRIGVYFGCLG